MSNYRVYYTMTVSTGVVVEAPDAECAEDLGYGEIDATLCHHCASKMDLSGDWEPDPAGPEEL